MKSEITYFRLQALSFHLRVLLFPIPVPYRYKRYKST